MICVRKTKLTSEKGLLGWRTIIGRAFAFYQSRASEMTLAMPRECHLKTNVCAIVTVLRVACVVQKF